MTGTMHSSFRVLGLMLCLSLAGGLNPWDAGASAPKKQPVKGEEYGTTHTQNMTADHSKFEALKQAFKSGPEVTKACLSCHTEAAKQIQKTLHWRWIAPEDKEGKIGKAGLVVNNFCVALPSNEPRCTSCHIGYGWKDKTFWHLTTGQWKHYIPTTKMLLSVMLYYIIGIFKGEPHPVPKSERVKHNPLQRLTYLGISVFLIPFQMITGLLYYTYNSWPQMGFAKLALSTIAFLHMAGGFALLVFLVVHIYMTTTGHSLTAHFRAMCSGWEDVPAPGKMP